MRQTVTLDMNDLKQAVVDYLDSYHDIFVSKEKILFTLDVNGKELYVDEPAAALGVFVLIEN